jgi:hypothetical protein
MLSTEPVTSVPLSPSPTLKLVRMVWFWMIASIPVLVCLPELSGAPIRRQSRFFLQAISGMSILCAGGWLVLRRKYVVEGTRQLSNDRSDSRALRRWQTGQIISFAMSEAIAMYGLNLRYRGLTFSEAATFYIAGLLLMIFSFPRSPIEDA